MPGIAIWIASLLAAETPTLPSWMAGCWIEERGPAWTEECWTAPRAGTMLGSGRSGRGGQLRNWETMQILPDAAGVPVFWGSPRGTGRTAFTLVSRSDREIVFANAGHDYPQRIRYWRDGDMLNAETSLADGSKAMRWRYRKLSA